MTPCRRVAATASLIGAVWGCGASTEPNAKVTAMVPSAAFNDATFSALIAGDSFRPAYRFDTMAAASNTDIGAFSVVLASPDGVTKVTLESVSWQSPKALAATVPAGFPAGTYDVIVTDPRSSELRLAEGFRSLGPDDVPPAVTIESPLTDTLIGEGSNVTVVLSADDGAGLLRSLGATVTPPTVHEAITCAVPEGARNTRCSFQFIAPAPTDETSEISIVASAADSVGNPSTSRETVLRLVRRPTLLSASQDIGPAKGGTAIVVEGTDFVEDATVVWIDGDPLPTLWISATSLQATTVRHAAGLYAITVATAGAESKQGLPFTFIAAPIIRLVCPLRGPLTGGTPITIIGNNFRDPQTLIKIGGAGLVPGPFRSATRIDGFLPMAPNPGAATILADDYIGGSSVYPQTFMYELTAADGPDAGADPT